MSLSIWVCHEPSPCCGSGTTTNPVFTPIAAPGTWRCCSTSVQFSKAKSRKLQACCKEQRRVRKTFCFALMKMCCVPSKNMTWMTLMSTRQAARWQQEGSDRRQQNGRKQQAGEPQQILSSGEWAAVLAVLRHIQIQVRLMRVAVLLREIGAICHATSKFMDRRSGCRQKWWYQKQGIFRVNLRTTKRHSKHLPNALPLVLTAVL
mmetsp:Transcript_10373/g.14909  ORF Transcript_10373/g.14909 Transcript_10373/m.14909 type:complete len:205 (+) Transcript_10373:559-1173(+)